MYYTISDNNKYNIVGGSDNDLVTKVGIEFN